MPDFQLNREQVLGQPLGRVFTNAFERVSIDPENERVILDVALATDTPIYQWFGAYVILDMAKSSIRLDRMRASGPALWRHNGGDHIGRWLNFRIEKGKLRADCKFADDELSDAKLRAVKQEILVTTSIGFSMYDLEPEIDARTKEQMVIDTVPVFRCKDYEPFETSWEPIPADIGAGTNRQLSEEQIEEIVKRSILQSAEKRNSTNEENKMTPDPNIPAPAAPVNGPPPPVETRSADTAVMTEIREWGTALGAEDFTRKYLAQTDAPLTLAAFRAALKAATPETVPVPVGDPASTAARQGGGPDPGIQLARSMPRSGAITAFKRESKEANALAAYRLGSWALATIFRNCGPNGMPFERSARYATENGLIAPELTRALSEGVNPKGGFLVPEEFGNDMIDLVLAYGVFRRNAHVIPMSSDTRSDPRFVSGPTVYFTGESQQITESDLVVDRVNIEAKKLAALVVYSSELNEDSVVDIGNLVADKAARAFAKREDECGFLGDGTSYYGGMFGVLPRILGLDGTIANIAGVKVGAGNAYSELTLQDFLDTMGLMPDFEGASGDRMKWYVNKGFYFNVMARLMLAGGGITSADVTDRLEQRFLGYPVEFVNIFPNVEANSQIVGVFGDLYAAATMGVRREFTLAESTEVRFIYDDIVAKATERFGINVHSIGNASSTAADRLAGPLTALITKAS